METLTQQQTATPINTKKEKSPFFKAQTIQKKLSIGSPNDPYEAEADAMADKVISMNNSQVSSNQYSGPLIQRKCAACEEEMIQQKTLASEITPLVQRKSHSAESGLASQALSQQINSSKGGGASMDKGTQNFMESRFGTDFSGVRIHTSSQAHKMSRELNAQAFTVGNDIYFNEGQYKPNISSGRHLLAHELTHFLQQKGTLVSFLQRQSKESQIERPDKIETVGFVSYGKLAQKYYNDQRLAWYLLIAQPNEPPIASRPGMTYEDRLTLATQRMILPDRTILLPDLSSIQSHFANQDLQENDEQLPVSNSWKAMMNFSASLGPGTILQLKIVDTENNLFMNYGFGSLGFSWGAGAGGESEWRTFRTNWGVSITKWEGLATIIAVQAQVMKGPSFLRLNIFAETINGRVTQTIDFRGLSGEGLGLGGGIGWGTLFPDTTYGTWPKSYNG